MGIAADVTEDFDCSDRRVIFKLLLAELRRLKKIAHRAEVELAKAEEGCRVRALDILGERA